MPLSDILTPAPTVSLEAHAEETNRHGKRLFRAPSGAWWYRNEPLSLTRFPNHQALAVPPEDAAFLFNNPRPLLLDWTAEPSDGEEGNALLYLFDKPEYSIEGLEYTARRDARRSHRELAFRLLGLEELLECGLPVFTNTRVRNGLSDGTPGEFRQRFSPMTRDAGYAFLGAFIGPELAGFISILSVEDWVSIGPYAHADFRKHCATDGLVSLVLDHFINTRKAQMVSYGLSSVQENSSRKGLHVFKIKVGFEAIPVRRKFRLHPVVAPFLQGPGRRLVQGLADFMPSSRVFRKLGGVLQLLD